jgi:hypothetical protein
LRSVTSRREVRARGTPEEFRLRRVDVDPQSAADPAVDTTVGELLRVELERRGLLLDAASYAAAAEPAEREGTQLLRVALERCYGAGAALEFEDAETAARLASALTFGSVTARVLAPRAGRGVELACAIFNLGIGLVDSLCDDRPELGLALLELDLLDARDGRGWLRASAPPVLLADHTAAFAIEMIETFFELVKTDVGNRLESALAAERLSIGRSGTDDELVESSRLTSVLPFEIIATLAGGDLRAATQLGEALWRIDDLVDLEQDRHTGALNAIVLGSIDVDSAAAEAAEKLAAGLSGAATDDRVLFLYFVQRYVGVTSPH